MALCLTLVASAARADRPDTPGATALAPKFAAGEVVETYGSASGSFLIHFSRAGDNAVPAADADANGIPDFVELAAQTYDAALAYFEEELGLVPPLADDIVVGDNGGDARVGSVQRLQLMTAGQVAGAVALSAEGHAGAKVVGPLVHCARLSASSNPHHRPSSVA